MITLIEALNFRCLRYVRQPLSRFHVLVGPNASGKTTFLDVVAFASRVVTDGLDAALEERSPNLTDLVFGRTGTTFELAIEAAIPEELAEKTTAAGDCRTVRYELTVGIDEQSQEASILAESVRFRSVERADSPTIQKTLFPDTKVPPTTICLPSGKGVRTAVSKGSSGSTNFYSEVYKEAGKGWVVNFKLAPPKSALGNLPEDESKFPVSTWLKNLLTTGIQNIVLDSLTMRKASPPGQSRRFKSDGSNLPWVIEDFRKKSRERYEDWISHLRMALPDLVGVRTVEREDDKHRYLMLQYEGGLEVPSWTASDGTLRLLALTLPAYLPELEGVFLIEEPENGIHPKAVDTLFQSLSNVYGAQVLLASHSPVILSATDPADVLCFAKDADGATDIVSGDQHPALLGWRKDTSLGVLFAAGVLG